AAASRAFGAPERRADDPPGLLRRAADFSRQQVFRPTARGHGADDRHGPSADRKLVRAHKRGDVAWLDPRAADIVRTCAAWRALCAANVGTAVRRRSVFHGVEKPLSAIAAKAGRRGNHLSGCDRTVATCATR